MLTYLFPGQGSQYKGMGESLFDEFKELTEQASDMLGYSVKKLCLEDENNTLNNTRYTQPALYVVNALSYLHKINETGAVPDFIAGHSLGEYNALQAAGAISFEDGIKLVKKRGELMSNTSNGAMAALLGLSADDVRQCIVDNNLEKIDVANYNSPTQIVVSGLRDALAKAQRSFESAGAMFLPLNTSGAFHSRFMNEAQVEYELFLSDFAFSDLRIPVISNVHAKPYDSDDVSRNLVKQITHSVRWTDSMLYLLSQGVTDFVELGVGDVLTKLMRHIEKYYAEVYVAQVDEHDMVSGGLAGEITNVTAQTQTPAVETTPEGDVLSVQLDIEAWNRSYPVGTRVTVRGFDEELLTRTPAQLLFGHRAAVYMCDYNGYFTLDDVTPIGDAI